MKRILAAFALAASVAHAQAPAPPAGPNAEAKELAQRLGREVSVEGLEAILKARNTDLLEAYKRGFNQYYMGSVKRPYQIRPEIEQLIIRYYADPVVGSAVRSLCFANGAHYQTRELFDLMYAEWRGKPRGSNYYMYNAALATDQPGIEPPLLDWIGSASPPQGEDLKQIIYFLGRRKYAAATPALIKLQSNADPQVAYAASLALADFATPESIEAVLQRVAVMNRSQGQDAKQQSGYLMSKITQLPPSFPLPYERLKKALPEDASRYAGTWLSQRKDLAAVPDALSMLGDQKNYPGSLNALIASDNPEVWKRARAEVERLKQQGSMPEGAYLYASRALDEKIASPEKHFAAQKQGDRQREFDTKRQGLQAQARDAMQVRETNPEQYVKGLAAYLVAAEALIREYADLPPVAVGYKGEVSAQYLEAGHTARFKLKQPARAIELYDAARRNGNALGSLAAADTYQFDLRDKAAALARYKAMLEEPATQHRSSNDLEASVSTFAKAWVAHQVAYLERGTTFSGGVRVEDCGAVMLFATYGFGGGAGNDYLGIAPIMKLIEPAMGGRAGGKVDGTALEKAMAALPPSTITLMHTAPMVAFLPDARSILAHSAKHDPAGFATACYFATMDLVRPGGASEALRTAAATFNRQHRIEVAKADPRMSTPQGTWNLLIESLRKGDSKTALDCLTPGLQDRFRELFTQPPARLREMAESFGPLTLTTKIDPRMQEGFVKSNRSDHGGMIYFIDTGRGWKINEM